MTQIIEVETQDGYNRWAPTYDSTGNPLIAIEEFALDEMLEPVKNRNVIDLGCGTGRNSRKLSRLGAKVTGVDFSAGMLTQAIAQSQKYGTYYIQHDLTQTLPFSDEEFDWVLCSLVIEHIRDLTPFFTEMKRVCKPNGAILVSDLHPAMQLKNAQAQFTDHSTDEDIRPRGFPHSMSEYILSLRAADLTIETMKEYLGRADLVERFPKMQRYVDWPMLIIFKLRKS